MPARSATLHLPSPDATCRLAQSLADRVGAGDVLLLSGGVGAGKTHFARCLILASLTQPEDVPSPTYTLVQTYHGRSGEIWHADLYRLTRIDEVEELGLAQAFSESTCLVEWPDRLGDLAPPDALTLTFDAGTTDDSRELTLHWTAPAWDSKLKDLINVRA